MQKCSKTKNPCKLCLQSVTNKTGLQCKGACKRWAHYSCLNYTPGKIQDIKAGIITIACPCPTCNTMDPKELLTNPPYTCDNLGCPAHVKCTPSPAKKVKPICKRGPVKIECPPGFNPMTPISSDQTQPPTQDKQCDDPMCTPVGKNASNPDEPSCNTEKMGSGKAEVICPKTEDSFQCDIKEKPKTAKTRSCCCVSSSKADNDKKKTFSDHKLCNPLCKESHRALMCNIQQLCSTVGHLSSQVKLLMCKMLD